MAPTRKKAEAPEATAEEAAPEAPAQETERQKRARLKTLATNTIIERHRDEFNDVAEAVFKENGLEFKRKLTPEEKAEKELDELLAANPGLREKLASKVGEQHSGDLELRISAETLTGDDAPQPAA